MKASSIKIRQLLEAVQSEQQWEIEKKLIANERPKIAFKVVEPRLGFGGKVVMTAKVIGDLSEHYLSQGRTVTLVSQYGTRLRGVVTEIGKGERVLELEDATPALQAPDASWVLSGRTNSITYKRMISVLWDMQSLASGRVRGKPLRMWVGNEDLVPTLLAPRPTEIRYMSGVPFIDKNLNVSQKKAVSHALGATRAALIHGPPGTGKTRVLVELIRQVALRGERVLVCASSNAVVDHVMKAAYDKGVDCLRLGNPKPLKTLEETKQCHMDYRIKGSEEGIEIERAEREREKLLAEAPTPSLDDWDGLGKANEEIRAKLAELRAKAVAKIVPHATAVFCTLYTAGGPLLEHQCFDVLIVDEATLALEPECWLAISHCRKVVLAGDVHQPSSSLHVKGSPLHESLFQRLLPHFAAPVLSIQYRMHEAIMRFPASQHYASLVAHGSVKDHLLAQIPGVTATSVTECPLLLINTAEHCLAEEHLWKSTTAEREAALAIAHVDRLVAANVPPESITIICLYTCQVLPLKMAASRYPQLAITNIDGALGNEKEAVVMVLGWSDPETDFSFLSDYRRLNGAITRARRHLCAIGNAGSLTAHGARPLANFVNHLLEHAWVCCPEDFTDC